MGTKVKPNKNQWRILAQACLYFSIQTGTSSSKELLHSPTTSLKCNLKLNLKRWWDPRPFQPQHPLDSCRDTSIQMTVAILETCPNYCCGVQTLTHAPAPTLTWHAEQGPARHFFFRSRGALVREEHPAFFKLCSPS